MRTHRVIFLTIGDLISPPFSPSPNKSRSEVAHPLRTKDLSVSRALKPGRQAVRSVVSFVPLTRQDFIGQASIRPITHGLGGPCFRCSGYRFVAQLFFGSNPVLDIFSMFAAALKIQLMSSASDLFSRWFSASKHGQPP